MQRPESSPSSGKSHPQPGRFGKRKWKNRGAQSTHPNQNSGGVIAPMDASGSEGDLESETRSIHEATAETAEFAALNHAGLDSIDVASVIEAFQPGDPENEPLDLRGEMAITVPSAEEMRAENLAIEANREAAATELTEQVSRWGTEPHSVSGHHEPTAAEHESLEAILNQQVRTLQGEVQERDHLITALTDRLEQAAEQLDRLRRSGADRGWRGGGGLPPDLIQDHRATIEELKGTLSRWEEMQASVSLGRIELQINELRDLIVQQANSSGGSGSGRAALAARDAIGHSAAASPGAGTSAPGMHANVTWWERQKAAMLGESTDGESAASETTIAHASPGHSAVSEPVSHSPDASESGTGTESNGFVIPDLPPAIDWEALTLEQAGEAIRLRDEIINRLREPLIQWQLAGLDFAQARTVEQLPELVQQQFQELSQQWQAKFCKMETELAIERARLSREQTALKQQQEQLQKLKAESHFAAVGNQREQPDAARNRRWFRFLGPGQTPADSV